MSLYNIWVSLYDMSDKEYWTFSWYSIFFLDVPVMDSGMKESLKGFVLANVFIIHFSA